MVRLPLYLIGDRWDPEVLLYADDWLMLCGAAQHLRDAGAIMMIFEALGIPMKWPKYRGGFRCDWIGYELNFEKFTLGISESRARWVRDWLAARVAEMKVDLDDLSAVLGRLSFAMGPFDHLRPFVAPIFAWSAAVGRRGIVRRLPWSMAFLFKVLGDGLDGDGRYIEMPLEVMSLGEAFRADAKADGADGGSGRLGVPGRQQAGRVPMVLGDPRQEDGALGLLEGRAVQSGGGPGALRDAPLCDGLWRRLVKGGLRENHHHGCH